MAPETKGMEIPLNHKLQILFLTPWYPSGKDAMSGLFVQKHVEAVRAQGVDVRVIFSQGWGDMWRQWRTLRREGWMPDLVQLNVIQKQGLLALWLKHRYGIPYIIVEHWSGYLPENGKYMHQPAFKRRFAERVAEQASAILPVSNTLAKAMQACGIRNNRWQKINNVVDDFFFEGVESQKSKVESRKTLLHVSCFDEKAKNTSALLRGFKELSARRNDVQLVMVGTGVDWKASQALSSELAIPPSQILWTGEQTPEQVCEWLHRADAFVLTSRYETAAIVLAEAFASGIPILSTPVGIATEIVTPDTGLIIPQENANRPMQLSKYLERIIELPKYDSQGKEFSAYTVGKQLKDIYTQCTVSE